MEQKSSIQEDLLPKMEDRKEAPDLEIEERFKQRLAVVTEYSKTLKRLNVAAFILQLGTSIAIFSDYENGKYSIWTDFAGTDEEGRIIGPEAHELGSFRVSILSGVFLILSALYHFIVGLVVHPWYEQELASGRNPLRWLEYAFSASTMKVAIAILSGVTNPLLLLTLFGLTATTMFWGCAFEWDNDGRAPVKTSPGDVEARGWGVVQLPVRWRCFLLGFVPHIFSWLPVLCYFFQAVADSNPPAFVWAIIFIEFILDLSFAMNLYLQWTFYTQYVFGEIGFIVLSFTSKQLLAWINYGGAKAR